MLKKCYGLFLGLVVLAGSACVTPTHASSASVVITNVRAGGWDSALQEEIVLYNNSSFEADISGWCLKNKSLVSFACINPAPNEKIILPAYSYALVISTVSVINEIPVYYTSVFEPTNQNSGAIVASSDTIWLVDADAMVVDQFSWTSTILSSQQWERTKFGVSPDFYLDTDSASDWTKQLYTLFPSSQVEYRSTIPPEPEEPELPEEPVEPEIPSDTSLLPIMITELLPNAVGSDTGNEFIEIYNPNNEDIQIGGYKLKVGPSLEKVITLSEYLLKAGEYKVFTNAELGYSLLNTSSRVSLFDKSDVLVSESPAYDSPSDGKAWALIGGIWKYTEPTPGAVNTADILETNEEGAAEGTSTLKPCAENQYRNPETNRCRLTSSSTSSTPTPCKVGQERNPETNRCRNITTASESTSCKEGQERNSETNRCRNIKELSKADFGVKGATTKQQSGMAWYMWAAIAGLVLLILGYAVWEWRDELKKFMAKIKAKFAPKAN